MESNLQRENEFREHIRLLAMGHKIMAAIIGFFSLFPLIHIGVGLAALLGYLDPDESQDGFPMNLIGGIFVGVGALIMVSGMILAILVGIAGKRLKEYRGRTYCLVMAGILCAIFPLGTVLGILSFLVLLKPEAECFFLS